MTLIEATQAGADSIINAGLTIDGSQGPATTNALHELISKLKIYFTHKNYEWFDSMLIGIRTNDEYTNKFTDWGILINGEQVYIVPISTKPGASYQKNPVYIAKVHGCACLVPGQYKGMWKYSNSGWSGDPYLMQVAPVTIYRDSSMGNIIDKTKTDTGLFGINFHSWKGFGIDFVQNLSAGCQVMDEIYLLDIMPILQKLTGAITYTLIDFSDFTANNTLIV